MNVSAPVVASKTWRLLAVFVLALVLRLVYNLYIPSAGNVLFTALCSCVLDALLAAALTFLGEEAFGAASGLLAGLCWCFYLPAIINAGAQMLCGEEIRAFVLTLYIALLFFQSKIQSAKAGYTASIVLGLVAAVMAGGQSIFALLPFLLLALHLIFMAFAGQLRRLPFNIESFSIASTFLLIMFLVYPQITISTMGGAVRKSASADENISASSFATGNFLPVDGWKGTAVGNRLPNTFEAARPLVVHELEERPFDLIGLNLRKNARLWAGVWNDSHQSCFAFSYNLQNIFQSFYLLMALLAVAVASKGRINKTRNFAFAAAMTLSCACAYQFVYILFAPLPRDAYTVMPLIITLAAAGIVSIISRLWYFAKKLRQRTAWQLAFAILLFLLFAAALYSFKTPLFVWSMLTQDPSSLRLLSGLTLATIYLTFAFLFWSLLRRLKLTGPLSTVILIKGFLVAALIAFASAMTDPAYLEWSLALKPGSRLETTLSTPDLGSSVPGQVYILVDAQAEKGPPNLQLSINGVNCDGSPLPLSDVVGGGNNELIWRAHLMDRQAATLRQWWLYPCQAGLFHFGKNNTVIFTARSGPLVRIFGDYDKASVEAYGENQNWPSLTVNSQDKAFSTADRIDSRVYEQIYFRGHSTFAAFASPGNKSTYGGSARVRLAVPTVTSSFYRGGALRLF